MSETLPSENYIDLTGNVGSKRVMGTENCCEKEQVKPPNPQELYYEMNCMCGFGSLQGRL